MSDMRREEIKMTTTTPAILANALACAPGSGPGLHPLNLSIEKGEIFGLVGHAGAGKTALLELFATLRAPQSGHASVAGFSIIDDPEQVRRAVGYVPQTLSLNPHLSLREHLQLLASSLHLAEAHARVEEVLDLLSLRGLAEHRPAGLPLGLKRRVGLAQAILHRPEVLLLDEPEAGLDPMEARQVRAAVEMLNADGMTVLLCTIVLGEMNRACSLMGVLAHGAMVFYGLGEARGVSWRDPAALERLYGALEGAGDMSPPRFCARAASRGCAANGPSV